MNEDDNAGKKPVTTDEFRRAFDELAESIRRQIPRSVFAFLGFSTWGSAVFTTGASILALVAFLDARDAKEAMQRAKDAMRETEDRMTQTYQLTRAYTDTLKGIMERHDLEVPEPPTLPAPVREDHKPSENK